MHDCAACQPLDMPVDTGGWGSLAGSTFLVGVAEEKVKVW